MASRRASLIVGAVLFGALTAGGVWWAMVRAGIDLRALRRPPDLSGWGWVGLGVLVPGVYVADTLRYRVLGAAAGVRIGWGACLEASVANFFFSWLTPGSALGAPAAIYTLSRRGIPVSAGALVAFGKTATSGLTIVCLAFLALALGLGPAASPTIMLPLVSATALVLAALALPVLAALAPNVTRGWFGRLSGPGWRGRVGRSLDDAVDRLGRLGARSLVSIFACHVLYFAVFVSIAVVVVMGFGGAAPAQVSGCATVFTAFSYVAPTPGGAGLTEAAADLFFTGVLPPAGALAAVLWIRGLTFYLQIGIGAVYGLAGGLRTFLTAGR